MTPRPARSRPNARGLGWLTGGMAVASLLLLLMAAADPADSKAPAEASKAAEVRPDGLKAPRGFRVRVVADSPALESTPSAMAFDDAGALYVAEWRPSDRSFETWEDLALPEGGTARVRRRRKGTTDSVRRLRDLDGDGSYESAEVVVEGAEMPLALLPWKNSLLLACVGRLERWSDEDGDGRFETRAILVDGFAASGRRGLGGIAAGADGWLYLTAGDGDHRVVGSDGSRVDLARSGGVFRCRPDGSRVQLHAMGLRGPHREVAFDPSYAPLIRDDDGPDGSKFAGTRLIAPVEGGDYGWRLRPGANSQADSDAPDFDRAAVDGERPGRLPALARLGRGSASGLVVYGGAALPESCRDLVIVPDPTRGTVKGFRIDPRGGPDAVKAETTILAATADDDRSFHPCQAALGADGAVYILDARGGEGRAGRVLRLTWEGDGTTPALATKPNDWRRIFAATNEQLFFHFMTSPDRLEAARAQRELIDRGPAQRGAFLIPMANLAAPLPLRLLAIQGGRQLWNDEIETSLIARLSDPYPEVRRLAAQALAWEPKSPVGRLVPVLLEKLDDPDGRVVREVALALARHAEGRAQQQAAAVLLRWLYAHPRADAPARDGVLRALERMGEPGVEEVALAVRTRRGDERSAAVALFTGLRSAQAADQLAGLVRMPDLSGPERLALVRMFRDIPPEIPVPTAGLAEFAGRQPDLGPGVKMAALDACRLAGNPASALVLALLDDADEAVRVAATEFAGRTRPPGSTKTLSGRLADPDRSAAERLAIVRALRTAGPSAFAAIDAAYLGSEDLRFRLAALRSLAEVDPAKSRAALGSALAGPDPTLRSEAVRIMAGSAATATLLGRAFLDRTLPRGELPAVLAALRKHDGVEQRKLLGLIDAEATGGPSATDPAEVRARVRKGADPWAGLGVFFRDTAARCSGCHQVGGRGSGAPIAAEALTADRLVDAILHHPKVGRPASGPVASRGGEAVTVSLGPKPPRPSVDGPTSKAGRGVPARAEADGLKPERAALELAPDDVADLVAFLLSTPARDSLKHGPARPDRVLAIGPLEPGADKLRAPLEKVEPGRSLPGQDGTAATWTLVEPTDFGLLDLRGEFGPRPGRAYLAAQIRSARDQAGVLRYAAEGPARVYLNGVKVGEAAGRDPSAYASAYARPLPGEVAPLPDLARLPLKAGWNLVVVAIDRTESDSALARVELASPEPVEWGVPPKP